MSEEFRVGLVGLGAVANFHIAALQKMRGVRLVAGCDPLACKTRLHTKSLAARKGVCLSRRDAR